VNENTSFVTDPSAVLSEISNWGKVFPLGSQLIHLYFHLLSEMKKPEPPKQLHEELKFTVGWEQKEILNFEEINFLPSHSLSSILYCDGKEVCFISQVINKF